MSDPAVRSAVSNALDLPERVGFRIKKALLGPPLISARLHEEKLSKKSALGVLSSDCISSSAYGSEEMLIFLLPAFGLAGFHILLPLTAVVLAVLVVMTLLYRQVVSIYTQAGGSYVVARDNFGPKVAQIAAVALLIDYVVTVAVQTAAGTAAVTSLVPALAGHWTSYAITVGVILVLAYGNLRGVREAGRAFALPTYLFVSMAGLAIIVGLVRDALGTLPVLPHSAGMIPVDDTHHAILAGASIYVLLKAFANGGASLTGLEAISNGVSAFKKPAGTNARKTLSIMSVMLGSLVLGISYLAFRTHATPYSSGTPTVISQVAHDSFGHSWIGHLGFVLVQIATAMILWTGANTPFTGFPFLASFIAEDSFLPRQMTRRGHRLAFSNGIIVLTVLALALVSAVGTKVDALIPFYAIGVFTGFAMAGFGMATHYRRTRPLRWRLGVAISVVGGVTSALVVVIFAVVKFSQGAWLVVVLFPLLWLLLMRLNARYRAESRSLNLAAQVRKDAGAAHYGRHTVLVLVDRLDLAVLRALRYAGSLRPTEVRAVHISLDNELARRLEADWLDHDLADRFPLAVVECPDRRLVRAVTRLALNATVQDQAEVTVLLPRRTFSPLSQRLLHDRTADRIAAAVGRVPHVNATIVPFDTTLPDAAVAELERRQRAAAVQPALTDVLDESRRRAAGGANGSVPAVPPADCVSIAAAQWRQKVTIEGRVHLVQVGSSAGRSLEVEVFDDSGGIRLLFVGRTNIPGIEPGAVLRATGRVGEFRGHLALANPIWELRQPAPA